MTATIRGSDATEAHERQVPPLGGFNLTALKLEVRRVLRNRRTVMFILVFPSVFFFMFGASAKAQARGGGAAAVAYIMISMAVYGAMVGTTAGGAAVAVERSLGWSRQLRLTPLTPAAYITVKLLLALVVGLTSILVVYGAGVVTQKADRPHVWLLSGLAGWLGSLVFAAFGLFMGFLLPSENVMQVVGPALAVLAMFGGLFIPLKAFSPTMQTVARFSPVWGVGALAHAPIGPEFSTDAWFGFRATSFWTIVFGAGAAMLFRRDTARV